ncbi:MAG: NfeD family protein [Oscillospiraceae bacterium]|nr:NfeD family protein [Oscillospiraceae bacterium]
MEIMPYIWFGIAILMAIVEGATYQLVSIWFVIGALVSAIFALFVTDVLWVQIMIFVAISLVAMIATRPFIKKVTKNKKLPTNSDKYIGMTGYVKIDIDNLSGQGQISVSGKIWSAKSEDDTPIKAGTKVLVKNIIGVKLIVSPVKE